MAAALTLFGVADTFAVNKESYEGGGSSTLGGDRRRPRPGGTDERVSRSGAGMPMSGFSSFGAVPDSATGDSLVYMADEITYHVVDEIIDLVGRARIEYQSMVLTAHRIQFFIDREVVVAEGLIDTAAADSIVGLPVFSSGAESFTGTRLTYNIRTKHGVVHGASSSSADGVYRGDVVKRTGEEQLDIADGVYTTCDDDHPHYAFESDQMRILVADKVIAKPIVMTVADVPIMWFPFGVFFVDKDRRSGFISPRMGENDFAGRFLHGFGYYFVPNDYADATALFSMDERNGHWWSFRTNYAWRYRLGGGLAFTYADQWADIGTRLWTLAWRHNQQIGPRSSLTANVNYTNQDRRTATTGSGQSSISEQFKSSVGYSQSWDNGYSVRTDFTYNKNLQTGSLTQVIPRLAVNSGRQYVFAQPRRRGPRAKAATEDPAWWRSLGYNWNWSGTNTRTGSARAAGDVYDVWEIERADADSIITYVLTIAPTYASSQYEGTYTLTREDSRGFPTELGSGRVVDREDDGLDVQLALRTASADTGFATIVSGTGGDRLSVQFPDDAAVNTWSRRKVADQYRQNTSQGVTLSLPLPTPRWLNVTPSASWRARWYDAPQYSTGGDSANTFHNFNAGISSSLTTYGLFPVGIGPILALRHVMTPRFSANYVVTRNMRGGSYVLGGREVHGDTSRVLALGLNNVFQLKALVGDEEKRFDRLVTVSTGIRYDMDSDWRKWSDPSTSIRVQPTSFFDVNVRLSHTFYERDSTGQDAGFDWFDPTLNSASVNSTLNLAGGGRGPSRPGEEGYVSQRSELGEDEFDPMARPGENRGIGPRSSWSPGWSLNLRHTYSWVRPLPTAVTRPTPTNQLDISAGISPWRDWDVRYKTKYDIADRRRYGDTIGIVRKLHCWEASLDWTLEGYSKGYYFRIYAIGLPDVKVESASAGRSPFNR